HALDDVHRCLASIVQRTMPPYRIIIVDDGSEARTHDYLKAFAQENKAVLIRNESALGYTSSANRGMRESTAPWLVLLNSDTIVTEQWLDTMWRHGSRNPEIGIIGPLSNAASWQSVPSVRAEDDWAINNPPSGTTPQEMADIVARAAVGAREMPFLNGF